jgi:hypothetical protein
MEAFMCWRTRRMEAFKKAVKSAAAVSAMREPYCNDR